MSVLLSARIPAVKVSIGGVAVNRSRLSPTHVPSLPRTRRALLVQSVARPSGSTGNGVNAAASSGGLSGLKQLVTPFSDPQANSKMLSLAAGNNEFLAQQ
jgi:hypothetical protein